MSVRSVERVTNVHRDTILRLLVLAAERCQALMLAKLQNLSVKDVEVDEIWGYVGKKEGHKSDDDGAEVGDAYCFIGMERSTKLILAHHLPTARRCALARVRIRSTSSACGRSGSLPTRFGPLVAQSAWDSAHELRKLVRSRTRK